MGPRSLLKTAALAAVTAALLLIVPTGTAFGVTGLELARSDDAADSLTTGAAARARADVQIRRIKTLIVTRSTDQDAAFDEIQRLQKDLRGQK